MPANVQSSNAPDRDARLMQLGIVALILLLFFLIVVSLYYRPQNYVDTTYGKRRGGTAASSVNGTSVLAGIFKQAGYKVSTWRRLSPKITEADVILWTPNDHSGPSEDAREFLEERFLDKPDKTVIYIGRDYDAEVLAWSLMKQTVPNGQYEEALRREAKARIKRTTQRTGMSAEEVGEWMIIRRDKPRRRITTLTGTLAKDIEATKTWIELQGDLQPPTPANIAKLKTPPKDYSPPESIRVLLRAGGDALVTELKADSWSGKVLVVTNGSFLLNLPLVNAEHRKLAARLINECYSTGKPGTGRVAFLESEPGGPPVFDKEPGSNSLTGWEMFTVWPINAISLHLAALGILACFAMWPIFGRPRRIKRSGTGEFSKHIHAMGELLQSTKDRAYASSRISQYNALAKRESSVSKADEPSEPKPHLESNTQTESATETT